MNPITQAIEALEDFESSMVGNPSCQKGATHIVRCRCRVCARERGRAALATLRSMPAEPVADALNTLCKMMHNGEEVEGDDGIAMLVPMDLWNEAQEAIELLVGEDDATPHTASAQEAA